MASFEVEGGHALHGNLYPQGAKNEALQVICATLLTDKTVILHNVPEIKDVTILIEMLSLLGVEVEKRGQNTYAFTAENLQPEILKQPEVQKRFSALRGSIMLVGPLLARVGYAYAGKPGGDMIGRRRIDTHFYGLQQLGAQFQYEPENNLYLLRASKLKGNYILLDEASVTGTANIIMAAVLAEGTTTIYNAACEPYIQQL
ncbi:MAG TPA: UDP-N-acetylglucosamine 1-carboxyvinyltransferase, partial [Bacteroidales bacterium]|nr:UDP-N-acetylglucosamine 1-carboxyvinyltransferase [Bacteroidales bacterium]